MSEPAPSLVVNVDPTNPGQFFACCGLLELADRLWPGAEGWFAHDAREFRIACAGSLSELLDQWDGCVLANTMSDADHARFHELSQLSKAQRQKADVEDEWKELARLLREAPILLKAPFHLLLDWFTDDFAGGSRLKTWAGQQSVLVISSAMKNAKIPPNWRNEKLLKYSVVGCGLPFNFDSDLGGQGGAIDIGFSLDPLAGNATTRIESMARPALEWLAFVGLQRFRPMEVKGENLFHYSAWNHPLPIQSAMPAVCRAVRLAGGSCFTFRLLYRTKYLKSFLPAVLEKGESHE